ncbi:MAG TPA: transcription termination/antitermination NusG family protein [bacterium]|nr:transcription termination/antitermination NusG family protein [bacterium]
MINWYAVQAKSHCEGRALSHLTQKAIPAFLPFIEVIHYYRSRRVVRLEPLFPSYLFVQLESMDSNPSHWNVVRWTPGVKSILGTEGSPMPVPDDAIDAIRARVKELGFVRPGPRFEPKARVMIRRGPLAGLEAVFERPLSGSGRVQVLMHLLGQQRRVQVDAVDLELV